MILLSKMLRTLAREVCMVAQRGDFPAQLVMDEEVTTDP